MLCNEFRLLPLKTLSLSHSFHALSFKITLLFADINISNQLIRAHSVKGHTAGAEEVSPSGLIWSHPHPCYN